MKQLLKRFWQVLKQACQDYKIHQLIQNWDFYKQTLKPWGVAAVEAWIKDDADTSGILPTLSLSAEEGEIYTKVMSNIQTYMLEEVNKVITGRTSSKGWGTIAE